MKFFILLFLYIIPCWSFAWGDRGHAVVAKTAAYLVATNPELRFFRGQGYNLGYYSNVPDKIWKANKSIYRRESHEHFVDLEIYKRAMGDDYLKPWITNRKLFFQKYKVKKKAGRALWRISELNEKLKSVAKRLRETPVNKKQKKNKKRKKWQGQWFLYAGVIAHYVGDLGQPLHNTENYDGQLTGQKGLHGLLDHAFVNHLSPQLEAKILKFAEKKWSVFSAQQSGISVFQMVKNLSEKSLLRVEEVLKIDKKHGRKNLKKVAFKYEQLIVEQMVLSSLYLAEIWRRESNWSFDGRKFFNFLPEPTWVPIDEG